MLAKDLETVLSLCSACSGNNDRIPLANALLQIFRHERHEAHLLKTLNDLDIDGEGRAARTACHYDSLDLRQLVQQSLISQEQRGMSL